MGKIGEGGSNVTYEKKRRHFNNMQQLFIAATLRKLQGNLQSMLKASLKNLKLIIILTGEILNTFQLRRRVSQGILSSYSTLGGRF